MAKRHGVAIRFRCPQCLADLKAPAALAGTPRRCPRCQFVSVVPSAAEAAARAAKRGKDPGYPLYDPQSHADSEVANRTYISVVCGVCQTRMDATPEQVGQQIVCPDCHVPVTVLPPVQPSAKQQRPAVKTGPDDEYPLCDGADQPDADSKAAHPRYIAVVCPLCDTLMHGTEDQVGQKIVCPDCQVPTVVPPPPDAARPRSPLAAAAEADGEYPLFEEGDQPRPSSPSSRESYIAVVCPLCQTRLHATTDQVGQKIVCPDCRMSVAVVAPRERPPKSGPPADPNDVYPVGAPVERLKYEQIDDYRRLRPGFQEASAKDRQRQLDLAPTRPRPPRWFLFSGILNFPFYAEVWPRWLVLSLGAAAVLSLLAAGVALALHFSVAWSGAPPFAAVGGLLIAMMLLGTSGVAGIIWAAAAFASCLAVVQDTAEGNEAIENWPEVVFLDWMLDGFFVLDSLALGAAVGLGAQRVFSAVGLQEWPAVPISVLVMFPVLLLSMLETGSPLNPLSAPVWRSLLTAWWAWGLFYLETTALLAAVLWFAGLVVDFIGILAIAVAAPVLVAMLLIYSRLLGQLAWIFANRSADNGHEGDTRPTKSGHKRPHPNH